MTVFTEITLLVGIATLVAFLMRLLRQPLVISYIATGLIVGPLFLNIVQSQETLNVFSEIGIALLLFIVGLNLTPKAIKMFGKVAIITGVGQVVFTVSVGWLISRGLGFGPVESLYLGIGLAFSSTIIILKLLSDKGDLEKLYGRISIGFLLVQDFIAVLILFLLPLFTSTGSVLLNTSKIVAGLSSVVVIYLVAHYYLPKLNHFISRSQELLFLFAIAWGLSLATLFRAFGFSLESGALIAGATLSILPSHDEIHARLKPLRDFFIILFFILLGAKMVVAGSGELLWPAILLSLFVLIGNPIILMIIMGVSGYRKKTSFQTGLTVAQISEFSLIVVALGVKLGHVGVNILSLTTIVGITTIFVSTYLIMHSDYFFKLLNRALSIFERKDASDMSLPDERYDVLLFGLNRVGYDFVAMLKKNNRKFLVVDYDPEIVDRLSRRRLPHVFGDAADVEFLRLLNWEDIRMVISTIPDRVTNKLILSQAALTRRRPVCILVASNISDAMELYKSGADYVLIPHFLGGHHASSLVEAMENDRRKLRSLRSKHITYLKTRHHHETGTKG